MTSTSRELLQANNSEKYFRNYDQTDSGLIKIKLAEIQVVLGIKGEPSPLEIQQLMIFLKAHFKSNTFADLKLGIGLNSARKLEKHYEHFQLLSTDFIGAILMEYNELLRKSSIELSKAKESATELTPKLPEAKINSWKFIKDYYTENKSMPLTANWNDAFEYLWENGLTESKEEMVKFFEVESEIIKKQVIDKMFWAKNLIEKRAIELQLTNGFVKLEVRKKYLQKMLTNLESF